MKKLPIGLQTFAKLITENWLYVDKTREICRLIRSGGYFFLSRPRRFGKSLLISTLAEIFAGRQALFQGLYIYDQIAWQPSPVIHLDCSLIPRDTPERLQYGLRAFVREVAGRYQLDLREPYYDAAFRELIVKLAEKSQQQVVVLIDEYDKPLLDVLDQPEIVRQNREILKNFYGMLKGSDPYLHFVFLTGVSKFAKVSIFSGLNNLRDITLAPEFSTMLGYTQVELEQVFEPHLQAMRATQQMSPAALLERIRLWYNGYSWDGQTTVYNPFSILNCLQDREFSNYWFATGTPAFLVQKIRAQRLEITALEAPTLTTPALDAYDVEQWELAALLFQTGYLTIKTIQPARLGGKNYVLGWPNLEVQQSLLSHLAADFTGASAAYIPPLHEQLFTALNEEHLDAFIQLLQALFAGIPYPLHLPEEAYYHSLFYMILKLLGADVRAEVVTDKGRIDGVLICDDRVYVIECKYGKPGQNMPTLTQQALKQIRANKYYEPFLGSGKKILLLGIGFVEKTLDYQVAPLAGKEFL